MLFYIGRRQDAPEGQGGETLQEYSDKRSLLGRLRLSLYFVREYYIAGVVLSVSNVLSFS
jgi:hypothetical protein